MQIDKLDHVNIRTTHLETLVDWYTHYLGLRRGARPDFPFPGAWMYAGDAAVVHLVGVDPPEGTGAEVPLKLEHFALTATGAATGAAAFEARLVAGDQPFKKAFVEDIDTIAINVWDPDGNHIHVDFRADEAAD